MTFSQGSFVDKAQKWRDEGYVGKYYSVDLSKATDRFPITLLSLVLSGHMEPDYVSAWNRVMVGHPFLCGKEEVYYAAGNPMGAYSS